MQIMSVVEGLLRPSVLPGKWASCDSASSAL